MQAEKRPFETYAVVEGFEGLYEVSNLGRVRRVGGAAKTGNGRGGGALVGRVLTTVRRGGYAGVQLWRDGRVRNVLVHRLAAAAFIGPLPDGHEVNHIDGNKNNNTISNLEYVTRSENLKHAYRTGLRVASVRSGESHHNARLLDAQVAEIRRRYQPRKYGFGAVCLAAEFGVSPSTINRIVRGTSRNQGEL